MLWRQATGVLVKENYMGYGNLKDVLGIFFIFLIIAIVIFLLLREFNCWYWKINQKRNNIKFACVYKNFINSMQKICIDRIR